MGVRVLEPKCLMVCVLIAVDNLDVIARCFKAARQGMVSDKVQEREWANDATTAINNAYPPKRNRTHPVSLTRYSFALCPHVSFLVKLAKTLNNSDARP